MKSIAGRSFWCTCWRRRVGAERWKKKKKEKKSKTRNKPFFVLTSMACSVCVYGDVKQWMLNEVVQSSPCSSWLRGSGSTSWSRTSMLFLSINSLLLTVSLYAPFLLLLCPWAVKQKKRKSLLQVAHKLASTETTLPLTRILKALCFVSGNIFLRLPQRPRKAGHVEPASLRPRGRSQLCGRTLGAFNSVTE